MLTLKMGTLRLRDMKKLVLRAKRQDQGLKFMLSQHVDSV